jgi:hypothetical protein
VDHKKNKKKNNQIMADIIVSKLNEAFLKINCEKHIAKELSLYFEFFVPGYQFSPAYRNKFWDGKIRLFHLNDFTIYSGLLSHIEEFCESNEYSIEYKDNLDFEDEFSLYHAKKFAESLNIHSNNKKIDINDHQYSVFVHTMQHKRALFVSPTASGKSLIAYMIFRQLHDYKRLKGLMIVPNTSLVEQMTTDFEDYSSHNNFNVSDNVNKIYDFKGMVKQTDKSLTISTWQSLFKEPKEFFEQFDYVIGDESHLFKSQSLITIMTSCVNAKYRIGMTGTLDGTKCFDGDTLINTINGKKKIKDITKNDKVLTLNENNKSLEYKPVLNKFNNGISKKMLKIKTLSGEIIVTSDHKICTKDGWKPAKDLTLNDEIVCIT